MGKVFFFVFEKTIFLVFGFVFIFIFSFFWVGFRFLVWVFVFRVVVGRIFGRGEG